jgi:hypothetical protein
MVVEKRSIVNIVFLTLIKVKKVLPILADCPSNRNPKSVDSLYASSTNVYKAVKTGYANALAAFSTDFIVGNHPLILLLRWNEFETAAPIYQISPVFDFRRPYCWNHPSDFPI